MKHLITNKSLIKTVSAVVVTLSVMACGTKKNIVAVQNNTSASQQQVITSKKNVLSSTLLQKIASNEVTENSIVSNISFEAQAGDRSISCPGTIKLYKDKMIRLQLSIPLLGTEVGRLEFTPTHVLVVDRIHKEYIQASYDEVDFLKANGLNFYSLQALFWNKLFQPAKQSLAEADLANFEVVSQANDTQRKVLLVAKKLTYVWNTDVTTGKINSVDVQYDGTSLANAGLTWTYNNFTPVGTKSFPLEQSFTLQAQGTQKIKKVTISFTMNGIKTNRIPEEETTLSTKYKKIDPKEILSKIIPN